MSVSWVACAYALALGLLLAACQMVRLTLPRLRGLSLVEWAIGMAALASMVRGVRVWLHPLPTVFGTNYLFLIYLLLVFESTAQLLQKKGRPLVIPIVAVWVAAAPFFWYFTAVHFDSQIRIAMGSGLKSLTSLLTALLGLGVPALLRARARTLSLIHGSFAALNLARCILTLRYAPGSWMRLDPMQTAFAWGQTLLCFATCCGIIWFLVVEGNQDLQRRADTDALTGLLNRRAFAGTLNRELGRCERAGSSLALILVDLDHFKQINDSLGHFAGDEVLRRVSAVLAAGIRPVDTLARYGGEEFIILLQDATYEQAAMVAERLRRQIEELPVPAGGVGVTASIGLAISGKVESSAALIDRCDQALYRSKRGGRNLVTVSEFSGSAQTT